MNQFPAAPDFPPDPVDFVIAEKVRAAQLAMVPEPQRSDLWTWEDGPADQKAMLVRWVTLVRRIFGEMFVVTPR